MMQDSQGKDTAPIGGSVGLSTQLRMGFRARGRDLRDMKGLLWCEGKGQDEKRGKDFCAASLDCQEMWPIYYFKNIFKNIF